AAGGAGRGARRGGVRPAREQRDRYGRLLARVEGVDGPLAGRDLARALALSGLARSLAIAPNLDDAGPIAERVARARLLRRGLWGACGEARAFPGRG
ncbi:MAG: thermonuclease family protein, partial [Gaiellales bacterium]